ncbi:MAG TPA: DegV family protein [Candidatus Aminicenantes bacterium]|nr:DegV family protein [Candidatus Aminicenantes bacterium]
MKIRYLDGRRLYHAFLAGGEAVISDQNYLNKINVFPVPDSDTGTNLATTMRAISQRAKASIAIHATMDSIADAAISGARGNSGIIFAQFIYGLSREMKNEVKVSTRRFGESVRRAVQYAHQAIVSPVEGTMITLIKDWADAVFEQRQKMGDFVELLTYSLHVARTSLRDTPKKLQVLAKAGVVDAGAKGFVDFLEGVLNFIKKGNLKQIARMQAAAPEIPAGAHVERRSVGRRFCSEALIVGRGLDAARMRSIVQKHGDSAVVAGSEEKVRIHVHTNSPAELFDELKEFGTIAEIKADDMLRQYEAGHSPKSKIALVTDSACDLPKAFLDEHQIHVIPFSLSFGESLYLDKVTITPSQFYAQRRASKVYPKTAQPPPAVVRAMFSFLASHYESVIVCTISDKLTGMYELCLSAATGFPGKKISVINTKQISGSQGLIVSRVAEAIRAGDSHDEVVALAERCIAATQLLVDVDSLKYLVRSGRVSHFKGFLARLLNLKPVLALVEGQAVSISKSFGRRANMKKIMRMIRRTAGEKTVQKYAIVHAQVPERADLYARELTKIFGRGPEFIMVISPVIGVHTGLGVMGVALLTD